MTGRRRGSGRSGPGAVAAVVVLAALVSLPAGGSGLGTSPDGDGPGLRLPGGVDASPPRGRQSAGVPGPGTEADGARGPTPSDRRPSAEVPRSFTLVAGGDVLLHPALWDQARADAAVTGAPSGLDFRPVLEGVKPLVSGADVAICHLETPLAPAGGPYAGYPSFSVPPEIAPALADTGFDACSTASNHTYDRGAAGVDRTLAGLDAAGIAHAGSARTPAEAAALTLVPAGPARVALLAYTFGFNGVAPPGGQAWRSNAIDEARIRADAARAHAEGADVVVVALHWGREYTSSPDDRQRSLGPALVRSPDVDLVLGHHAHWVQPVEQVGGEWVVYGMGNLLAHQTSARPRTDEGVLVRFTFTEGGDAWRVTAAEYAPVLVERDTPPIRLRDVGAALGGDAGAGGPAAAPDPERRARLREAWDRTVAAVEALGGPAHGLRPVGAAPASAAP